MPSNEPHAKRSETEPWSRSTILIGLLGAYSNAVAYGFVYGKYNHEFDLPLVNWLRDPSLYSNDPITNAFTRFPSFFWLAVAYLSKWVNTEKILFFAFLLTKVLFFLALARLVARAVKDNRLAACILLSVALSPFLNDFTPFGASDVLNAVQTHTSLAIALLLWSGYFLLEGQWVSATIVCAFTTYLDALFLVYTLFAFLIFAVLDWPARKTRILLCGLLGAAISLPWLMLSRGAFYKDFPKGYVEALLAFYPLHLKPQSHEPYDLICGAGLLVAAVLMARVTAKAGLGRQRRLEMLAAAYFIPVLLGAFFGEFFLPPTLARLQLLRADSFLLLYSILLIQIYGANLLLSEQSSRPATTFFLASTAILLPVSDSLGLLWALFIALIFWADPVERLENSCRRMAQSRRSRRWGLSLVVAGIIFAALPTPPAPDWIATAGFYLALFGAYLFACSRQPATLTTGTIKLVAAICAIAFLAVALDTVPQPSSLWNFSVPVKPLETDWRALQLWAKADTSRDAQFLVPTYPCGFRVFSERSSWGEWKDGQAAYHWPPFADIYRDRMQAIGFPWRPEWIGTKTMMSNYKQLPWERLLLVARANRLSYIIQFREVQYPSSPIYMNGTFAVYPVPQ